MYTSGKFTVQGKEKDEFIQHYLEPEILKEFSFSYPELSTDMTPRIGVDEAGKGDVFGSLCIAGVYADEKKIQELLKLKIQDSKRLSDSSVLAKYKQIINICPYKALTIHPEKYNELYKRFFNLNHLLAWGHATVIDNLFQQTGCQKAIVDQFGHESLVENAVRKKGLNIELTQRHKGEEDVVVAAASIVARAHFLESLEKLGNQFNVTLPKGASNQVISIGRRLTSSHGPGILEKTAKMHFKTIQDILAP